MPQRFGPPRITQSPPSILAGCRVSSQVVEYFIGEAAFYRRIERCCASLGIAALAVSNTQARKIERAAGGP